MRRFALAALVAAMVLAAPAQASKDGIERATQAGVKIDPAVEELMERAIDQCGLYVTDQSP